MKRWGCTGRVEPSVERNSFRFSHTECVPLARRTEFLPFRPDDRISRSIGMEVRNEFRSTSIWETGKMSVRLRKESRYIQ
jgi:hypothetical protein